MVLIHRLFELASCRSQHKSKHSYDKAALKVRGENRLQTREQTIYRRVDHRPTPGGAGNTFNQPTEPHPRTHSLCWLSYCYTTTALPLLLPHRAVILLARSQTKKERIRESTREQDLQSARSRSRKRANSIFRWHDSRAPSLLSPHWHSTLHEPHDAIVRP